MWCERIWTAIATCGQSQGPAMKNAANLVDNACKYAAGAEDRRIHVQVQDDPRWLRHA